ncbi:hypothetical protein NDU88_001675 [Pleurodeles waltl]|uniref:Uncharacterized protein n=1 Tax=Pleurodeles waltl TaxID=8319 RepID=A0AAV7Q3T6_PLEWA|nr:hypothetical protein NDU88_001675 [Pleurodeles waltl]
MSREHAMPPNTLSGMCRRGRAIARLRLRYLGGRKHPRRSKGRQGPGAAVVANVKLQVWPTNLRRVQRLNKTHGGLLQFYEGCEQGWQRALSLRTCPACSRRSLLFLYSRHTSGSDNCPWRRGKTGHRVKSPLRNIQQW